MRWLLIATSLALAVLAAMLAANGSDESHEVLEARAVGSTGADADQASSGAPRAALGYGLDRIRREGLIGEDDVPLLETEQHPEDVLPPGFRVELPTMRSKDVDPEITSPLPDDYELEAFDGPLVRAEYEDGTLWFEAQRSLNAESEWRRDGMWTCWHSNGELHEQGEYRGGVAHGSWSWWYPDGNRMATGRFANGQRTGAWSWFFDTGDLALQGQYANDEAVGMWTLYYPSGGRQASGAFDDNGASGPWTVWTESGAIDRERTGEYRDGVLIE